MRKWWVLWSGHVIGAATAVGGVLMFSFLWQTARSVTERAMFWNFVIAALAFIITMILGVLAAWRFKTKGERRYIRRENDLITNALEPAGRVDLGESPRSTGVPYQGVSAAQVAEERVTDSDR